MPPIESPSAASIPFINLFASMASSVENSGVAEPTYKALFLEIIYAQKSQRGVPNEKHAIIIYLKTKTQPRQETPAPRLHSKKMRLLFIEICSPCVVIRNTPC
jgi:hypothetical protein